MAVTFGNPLIVPSADAAVTVLINHLIYVSAIRWVPSDAAAVGDEVVVKNRHGVVVFHDNVGGLGTDAGPVRAAHAAFPGKVAMDGIAVPTLDDGTLYIYFTEAKNQ